MSPGLKKEISIAQDKLSRCICAFSYHSLGWAIKYKEKKNADSWRNKVRQFLCIIDVMIALHKLNGVQIFVNAELIESVEKAGDTVINLATGNRFLVRESAQEVVDLIVDYRKKVYSSGRCVNPLEGYEKK